MSPAVKIIQLPHGVGLPLPAYASEGAAGMDLVAAVDGDIALAARTTCVISTGIAIALSDGYEAQIRPRSGLAAKHGIGIINSPGTIDSDYRGEIMVILTNFSDLPHVIKRGDRIAQLVVARYERICWDPVPELPPTARNTGGLGHSGR